MIQFVKSRPLDALIKSILVVAVIHDTVTFILFLLTLDINVFNIFRILSIDMLFPMLQTGILPLITSWIFFIAIFAVCYYFLSGNKKKE